MTKVNLLKMLRIMLFNLAGVYTVGISIFFTIANIESIGIVLLPILIILFLLDYIIFLSFLYSKLKRKKITKEIKRDSFHIILRFVNVFLLTESIAILLVLNIKSMKLHNYNLLKTISYDAEEITEYKCHGTNYETYNISEKYYDYILNGYDSLTYKERTQMLYDCALYEASSLGVDFDLQFKEIDKSRGGYYDPNNNKIVIRKSLVENEDSSVVLYALFHEIYHCYCYFQVLEYKNSDNKKLAIYKDASIYDENFECYTQPSEDKDIYRKQPLEKVANEWAGNEIARLILISQNHAYENESFTISK